MFSSVKYVEPIERTVHSEFTFRCHKGISCFNACCRHADVLLTPYDIVRLKRRLGISSGEFLKQHTRIHIDEASSHPYAVLKMMDNRDGQCSFATPEGCSVYEDRPVNCRLYPVGQGLIIKGTEDRKVNEEFYFFIKEPNCLGLQEDKRWSIESWKIDQGVGIYDEMNREWKEIQLRRDAPGQPKLDPKKQTLLYMASYDIDAFRKYVFDSKLTDIIDIGKQELEKIKTDEVALMKFGFRYLKYILMIEKTLKMKGEKNLCQE